MLYLRMIRFLGNLLLFYGGKAAVANQTTVNSQRLAYCGFETAYPNG
jgi:hypothetical protein